MNAPLLFFWITAALWGTGSSDTVGPATSKRAFTIADLYRIKGVSDPRISPDGSRIVYVVEERDLARAKSEKRLWWMRADGAQGRPLTRGPADHTPCWSPDGSRIAFVSERSGVSQIWILPAGGGEARQLTTLSRGASDPLWSPDGRTIAFTSEVDPDLGDDDDATAERDRRRSAGPLAVHVADHLLYRHWTGWRDGKRSHLFVVDVETADLRDLTPGDRDVPPFQLGGPLGYAFSPDSRELCYMANPDEHEARSTNADLWVVPVAGGEPRDITADNKAWDGSPSYSPDGRTIAYRTQSQPGYESDRFRLAIYDRARGTHAPLTAGIDASVDDFAWLPDSRRILLEMPEKGREPFFLLDLPTRELTRVIDVATADSFSLAPDGTWLAASRRAIANPSEIVRASLDDGTVQRLTRHNQSIEEEVDLRPAEVIEIPGADRKPVQVYLIKPHGFDPARRYPLILNIHGGPQMAWADAFRGDWQVYPGAGYVLAFPNPHGSTGFGQAYTAAISRDWAGKVMEDIDRVTESLAGLDYVDAKRIGAMGWSWGGYAMMWLEGHSERYRCLASMMGLYDLASFFGATEELWFPTWDLGGTPWSSALYSLHSPSRSVASFRTPCLVITGERDYRVPYTQSLQFFTALQVRGVPSRLIVFEKAGHWPAWYEMALYYNAHLDWFHRYLGGAAAPWDTVRMARNEQVFEVESEK